MILSGTFDRFPNLHILLAHSGGALPQLASRLASCVIHDPLVASRLRHDPRFYIGNFYFDAVAYGPEELGFVSDVAARTEFFRSKDGSAMSTRGALDRSRGALRMLFGTDHPFFPPLSDTEKWLSVVENERAIDSVQGWSKDDQDLVRGGNALKLFKLQ